MFIERIATGDPAQPLQILERSAARVFGICGRRPNR